MGHKEDCEEALANYIMHVEHHKEIRTVWEQIAANDIVVHGVRDGLRWDESLAEAKRHNFAEWAHVMECEMEMCQSQQTALITGLLAILDELEALREAVVAMPGPPDP